MDCSSDDSSAPADYVFESVSGGELDEDAASDASASRPDIEAPCRRKIMFETVLPDDLQRRVSIAIEAARDLLGVDVDSAYVLLRHFRWDLARLQEEWFDNEERIRRSTGLLHGTSVSSASSSQVYCPVCMSGGDEGADAGNTSPTGRDGCAFSPQGRADGCAYRASASERQRSSLCLGCGHYACESCWRRYAETQVDTRGKASILTTCLAHKCTQLVPPSVLRSLCDVARCQKIDRWYLSAFVDDARNIQWCPSPQGCNAAVLYRQELSENATPEVRCDACGYAFCWQCKEEAHYPTRCLHVSKWNLKNSAESENVSWIMANTKNCPQCRRPIEKNQGCNHIVCSKSAGGCGHDFCWLCLGPWASHGSDTGGYYLCNIYEKRSVEGGLSLEEINREKAKLALDKYMFYFERFMNHGKAVKFAQKSKKEIANIVQSLHDNHSLDMVELHFLWEALAQIMECRRVLKWSYVYGYYLDDPAGKTKELFEFFQKNLEQKTEQLQELIEKDFESFFKKKASDGGSADDELNATLEFREFRSHVTNFTNVTQKFLMRILLDVELSSRTLDGEHAPPEYFAASFRPVLGSAG
eukprot:GEMP01020779.1.p1 GENE.GEMP01020779.1~~GEMP01020779.1.p1  ORF type:complete len:593 (+),score=132.02 GEMP01020779.1:24-1781(+)